MTPGHAAYVDIIGELGGLLLTVEKPARYVGGEVGILAKKEAHLHTLIAFPDLYEIGMGNQALRIIYNRMNEIDGVSCDRAFAPAPDFEKLLYEKNLPLYGLDTGIKLGNFDLLMFTVGYELGLNGILSMLDVSVIPLHCEDRKEEHPIVIAGGPAVSNPLPFSPFIDAFWIGEAEAGFFDLACELAQLKKRGKGRTTLFEHISSNPHIWVKGKEKNFRAIFLGFSASGSTAIKADAQAAQNAAVFPIPSMKIVQHHGAVEIMRGCPNGCRFCHAGFWYRPARQKPAARILSEVKEMVNKGGWHEISLSSLSSGDYVGVDELVETLNNQFRDRHVSFQMPSLKVSSFSLSLLEKISATRKSGITFAVETPLDLWQMAINKEVTHDSVVSILDEAKRRGWKTAKFYFMIGLPIPEIEGKREEEEEEIVDFILDVARRTRMHFNINVGIFIPKPYTPYQWAKQIDSEKAVEKMNFIRNKLKPFGHKVSSSDPLISRIEGLLSRGDERAGQLCEQAYHGGSRLDAWSEYIDKETWQKLLDDNLEIENFSLSGKHKDEAPLPWDSIDSGVSSEYLSKELEKSNNAQRTASCNTQCSLCGVGCHEKPNIIVNQVKKQVNDNEKTPPEALLTIKKSDPDVYRVLFAFSKRGSAVFHGHLSLIEIFSMAFTRANLSVLYTQGFNPLAKIEFASPLSTGINASHEIAAADFTCELQVEVFLTELNKNLPQGIRIEKAQGFHIQSGMKKHSVSSLLWGFSYYGKNNEIDYVKTCDDKSYRQKRLEDDCSSLFDFNRIEVLARNISGGENEWASYFDVYGFLYPLHQ